MKPALDTVKELGEGYYSNTVESSYTSQYSIFKARLMGNTVWGLTCSGTHALLNSYKLRPATKAEIDLFENKKAPLNYKYSFKPLIGADPEMFVVNDKGEVIPSFLFLKHKSKNSHVYWDGYQAEFTTLAQGCLQSFAGDIKMGLEEISKAALLHDKTAKVSSSTLIEVTQEELDKQKREHVAFGCAPTFNAYNMGIEGLDGATSLHRSAGGHLHFGVGDIGKAQIEKFVRFLDATVGIMCVSLFAKLDNPIRRTMYGLAGEYRMPKHGMEYRVLSNAWLCHPLATHIVGDLARRALAVSFLDDEKIIQYDSNEVVQIINTCDVAGARAYMVNNMPGILKIINSTYNDMDFSQEVFNIFYSGIETAVKDPHDVMNNWKSKAYRGATYVKDPLVKGSKIA